MSQAFGNQFPEGSQESPLPIAILGSTGSIGRQALDLARELPHTIRVVALGAGSNVRLLAEQAEEFQPELVSLGDESAAPELRSRLDARRFDIRVGTAGLEAVATHPAARRVLGAITGAAGLNACFAALESGRDLALANKEVVVAAGQLLMKTAQEHGVRVLPVDSEPSALFQCLQGEAPERVKRLILTASGGAFRNRPASEMAHVTPEEALAHPTWKMGDKITVDCATLMNKGLEIIEARWLFGIPADRIDTLLHHQSIVHSLVEFVDGAIKAQLGIPDMRLPILFALLFPQRVAWNAPTLDLATLGQLTFGKLDLERWPCLRLACRAAEVEGTLPAVLSAADEVAVQQFLGRSIAFTQIPWVIERVMGDHDVALSPTLTEIRCADRWARARARHWVERAPSEAPV